MTFLITSILGTSLGDVNLDLIADATDLAIVRANIGISGSGIAAWSLGNIVGDSAIDQTDVAAMRFHFGTGNSVAGSQPIPEPEVIGTLVFCAIVRMWGRCSKHVGVEFGNG